MGLEGDFNKIDGRVMATPGTVGGASNGLLLFGLTTAFLFAIGSDLRGWGGGIGFFEV